MTQVDKDEDKGEGEGEEVTYWRVFLSESEAAMVDRRVTGTGGMQTLLKALQQAYRPLDRSLLLSDKDVDRIYKYYYSYGFSGGMQQRLAPIIRHIKAATDPQIKRLDAFGFST